MIKNTDLLSTTDLYLYEVGHLMVIQQLPNKDLEEKIRREWFNDDGISLSLLALEESGYVKHIKSKKKPWQSVRLTRKATDFLSELNTAPISSLAKECMATLVKAYSDYDLKGKIRNKSKTQYYLNEWLHYKEKNTKTPYTLKQFKAVLYAYLESFPFNEKYFTKNTLSLFFESDNAFSTRWYPESCPFEDFIQQNREAILKQYKLLP